MSPAAIIAFTLVMMSSAVPPIWFHSMCTFVFCSSHLVNALVFQSPIVTSCGTTILNVTFSLVSGFSSRATGPTYPSGYCTVVSFGPSETLGATLPDPPPALLALLEPLQALSRPPPAVAAVSPSAPEMSARRLSPGRA
ncbi:MAG: hypothetical protein HOV67_23335 [Kribbellaceae bacterium]|nr:hypothetical protein [Kribbellaceae bacterium]